MKEKFSVQVDGKNSLKLYPTEQAAVDAADRYNEAQEPGSPFAYAYSWDAENEEWICL